MSWRQQCAGKRTYTSKHEAKKQARRSETVMASGKLTAYKCPWCERFHVGHPSVDTYVRDMRLRRLDRHV